MALLVQRFAGVCVSKRRGFGHQNALQSKQERARKSSKMRHCTLCAMVRAWDAASASAAALLAARLSSRACCRVLARIAWSSLSRARWSCNNTYIINTGVILWMKVASLSLSQEVSHPLKIATSM